MISKTMRTILHALSYGNIDVEASRRLVDLKKLDAMRIFIRKLDKKGMVAIVLLGIIMLAILVSRGQIRAYG